MQFQQFDERSIAGQVQHEQILVAADDPGVNRAAAKRQLGAGPRRLAGADVRGHARPAQQTFDQHFDLAARAFLAEEPRRYHARIVENQQIAGGQQLGKIRHAAIQAAILVEYQQAAAAAGPGGSARD